MPLQRGDHVATAMLTTVRLSSVMKNPDNTTGPRHLAGDGPRPVRAGSAWPSSSDRSARRGLQDQAWLRVYVRQARSSCAHCPAVTVTLDAGGAGTYTKQAIPGSEPAGSFGPYPLRWTPGL